MTTHAIETQIAHAEKRLADLEAATERQRAAVKSLRVARRAMEPMEPTAADVAREMLRRNNTVHTREIAAAMRARIARYDAMPHERTRRLATKYLSAWPFARSVGKARWAWVPDE